MESLRKAALPALRKQTPTLLRVQHKEQRHFQSLGMGDRLFAVPWQALTLDTQNKRSTLNASKDQLKNAPSFDKDHWPAMADTSWGVRCYADVCRDTE